MGFIRRQLLKVIKWDDASQDIIVYRYPMEDRDEIMNGCQLIVAESQVAMLVSGGQIGDVYGPGTHKLTTNNMPIITKLASWKYGFDSPFKADVYYVNTKQFINLKWGTASKVPMRDADFGVIRVGARGSYSFRVDDAPTFMREIFGTNKDYRTESLKEYFRSLIVTTFTNALGNAKIPALDLSVKYLEIAEEMKDLITVEFEKMGVEVVTLMIENISLPENVEKAMDERASVGVLGDKMGEYTQYQTAQAIRDAANNESGGAAGSAIGIGVGVGLGAAVAKTVVGTTTPTPVTPVVAAAVAPTAETSTSGNCTNCGNALPTGAKFCPNCGTAVPVASFCTNCGERLTPGARFCSKCGKSV